MMIVATRRQSASTSGLGFLPPGAATAAYAALSASGRAIVAAIQDMPKQRAALDASWSAHNGWAETYADMQVRGETIPAGATDAIIKWRAALERAEESLQNANAILVAGWTAASTAGRLYGLPIPTGLSGPPIIAIGIAVAVVLVAGGFVGAAFYREYENAKRENALAKQFAAANDGAIEDWKRRADAARASGQPTPPPPILVAPPERDNPYAKAASTLAIGAVAAAGLWALAAYFKSRRGT